MKFTFESVQKNVHILKKRYRKDEKYKTELKRKIYQADCLI